jgi:hypothetical protein
MKLGRKKEANQPRRRPTSTGREPGTTPYSYRARRSEEAVNVGRQLNREKLKPVVHKARRFLIARFGLLILLIAAAASLVSVATLSPNADVLPLNSNTKADTFLRPTKVYQDAANKLLSQSIWNRNKITIDTDKVSQELVKQFPELSNASVVLPLVSHRPIIYIEPAQPTLIMVASNGAYVIDASGKALSSTQGLSAAKQQSLPTITDQTGFKVTVNKQALPADDVQFIRTVTAQLAAKGYQVSTITLPAAASELDVRIANQPYYVKFNLQTNDPREQAGTFLATMAELKQQNVTPAEYVDVRIDTHAYYK